METCSYNINMCTNTHTQLWKGSWKDLEDKQVCSWVFKGELTCDNHCVTLPARYFQFLHDILPLLQLLATLPWRCWVKLKIKWIHYCGEALDVTSKSHESEGIKDILQGPPQSIYEGTQTHCRGMTHISPSLDLNAPFPLCRCLLSLWFAADCDKYINNLYFLEPVNSAPDLDFLLLSLSLSLSLSDISVVEVGGGLTGCRCEGELPTGVHEWAEDCVCLPACVRAVMHMRVCYGVQLMACDIQCVGDSTSRELETHIARKKTSHTNPHTWILTVAWQGRGVIYFQRSLPETQCWHV